ncbi:MAG: hypothetical protein ACLQCU_05735, partial [Acidimicrobiales bacterium]
VSPRRHEHPVPWKAMARVTWLQRRSTLIGLLGVFVACAVAIVVGQTGTHATYASFVANGCVQNRFHTPCGNFENWFADNTDLFSAMVIALHVVPVVIGVFVGAPLLSRELESGTFRFTWTQAVGRSRAVVTTLVLLALFVTVATCVLGLLLNWFAHPFEIIGIESQWQSGLFDTTGPMLAAWTLFALAFGTFLGALIGRTVAAMAVTAATVGGLLVVSFVWLVARLEAIGALATTQLIPMGLNVGQLNVPGAQFNGPVGSWLVRAWFTGPGGMHLSAAAADNVIGRMYNGASNGKVGPSRWLSVHHYIYWVSYQPASRFWVFQIIAAATLVVLAALLVFATVRLVRRRA